MMRTIFANRACGILYRFIKLYPGRYLMPANVCPVVPLTFKLAEVEFDFVDIDDKTLCINEQISLALAKSRKCNGLVFVHTYGTQYNPQLFFRQLKTCHPSFRIVDDKCLCAPSFLVPQTEADLTLFSTGYAKYIDLGKGGFGFLSNRFELSEEPLQCDGFDIEPIYKNAFAKKEIIGGVSSGWLDAYVTDNYNDEYRQCVECEMGRMKTHKQMINDVYKEQLSAVKTLPDDFNQWRFNILVENKHEVLKKLFDAGLFASSHYQPSSGLFVEGTFPVAQKLYDKVINLFNDKYFTCEKAKKAAVEIRRAICI